MAVFAVPDRIVTMREKIARAIHASMDEPMPRFVQQKWEDLTDLAREAMFRRADAVLDALTEPTLEMGDAGRDVTGAGHPYSPEPIPPLGYLQIGLIWNRMIAKAKEE